MAKTAAERQAEARRTRHERFERRTAALHAILAKLKGNDKPLAVELRALAEDGLA
jgi:hypothetical protein